MNDDKKIFCINCGKKGHGIFLCNQPLTSYGIINFKFIGKYEQYNYIFKKKYIIKYYNVDFNKINLHWYNKKNINKECETLIQELKQNILILLISRKHSLGYVEFIRGRYDIEKLETIKHLFILMTEHEIYKIQNNDFDFLWLDLWKKTANNKIYEKEYDISLNKFNLMKEKYFSEILEFKPLYPISEWGFPKGKRNYLENDINCAIRECSEETNLDESEIKILDRIYPLIEIFKGTNNIEYKHVYYLSIIDSNRNLNKNTNLITEEYQEVENIGWFKYNKILSMIRPYHNEKKYLLNELLYFLAYNILLIENVKT